MSRHDERTAEELAEIARTSPLFQIIRDPRRRASALDPLVRMVHATYPGKHQNDFVAEMIASTVARALGQEGTPNAWDPGKEPAHERLYRAFDNERKDRRRAKERKPTVRLIDGDKRATATLNPEQEAAVADEERLRKQLADEAYDHLEENTQNDPGLTTRILDRLCEGDVTHQQLADELGVELSDIQNACKRIRRAATIIRERHDERVAEEARKLLELEERAVARPGGRRA